VSEHQATTHPGARATRIGLGGVAGIVLFVFVLAGPVAAGVIALALLGTPLFAVMGGASELAWLLHKDAAYHHLRYLAPKILDEQFAGSPILVTIPLFTFVGYLLAESKTPERLVRTSTALFGWMPGGLAIVCIVASAVFTVFTGGSGVTIIAIGGLLYPALRKEGYSDRFALGIVTTGGSVGLLLPYSLPLLVYSLVAQVDFNLAFKAVIAPGLLVLFMLSAYAAYIGYKENIPRRRVSAKEMAEAVWALKWELGIPVILVVGLTSGLTQIDECAGLVALYTLLIEVFIYKDLSIKKDLVRIAKASMALAGAVMLILAMANALINYVIQEEIPKQVLDFMLRLGLDKTWQFLIVMNVFLLVLGMVMDGFSAILVAVPLVLPFAAHFGLGPFHVAIIFILNLEIAFCCPPLGLNLFISSFRFNRPVVSLYRVVVPFAGLLTAALLLVSYIPRISNALILGDIAKARAQAEAMGAPPRDAWKMECVQADPSNPLPCSEEDKKRWPNGQALQPAVVEQAEKKEPAEESEEDLLKMMEGKSDAAGLELHDRAASGAGATEENEDDLLKKMMGAGGDAGGGAAKKEAKKEESEDDLFKQMMAVGRDGGT
jgi:tripartite ATP-independent transporter DctM subunit